VAEKYSILHFPPTPKKKKCKKAKWLFEEVLQIDEKDKYHILTHIYMKSRKMVLMNLFSGQKWDRDIKNRQ